MPHKKYTVNKKNIANKTQKRRTTKETCSTEFVGLKLLNDDFEKEWVKSAKQSNAQIKVEFIKQLMTKFAPDNVRPNQDFYDYINYNWLKKISLEKSQRYITQIDDFRLTQDNVYRQLNEIILYYIKHNKNKLATNMKNFYYSAINMAPIKYSKKLSKETASKIDELRKDKNNIWKLLAMANQNEAIKYRGPFEWSLNPDGKESTIGRCYIDPHNFFLVDINVYYDDGKDVKYKKQFRSEFKKLCKKVFDITLGPEHGLNPDDVFAVEQDLIHAFECPENKHNVNSTYNKITTKEALADYGFDWKEFAKELGFSYTPPFFITSNTNYLKCATKLMLENWDSEKWRSYWMFIFLKNICRMTRYWEDIIFDFFGKFERGQGKIVDSAAVSAVLYMSIPFNKFLTENYVAKYENPRYIKYVEAMCHNLRIIFISMIKHNTWLSPSTKKYAILKLKKIKFEIAKPKYLRPDPDLDYGNNLIENMKKIFDWRHRQWLHLEGKPIVDVPMMDWSQYPVKMSGSQAYIVNASYTPSKNGIYINLGYIQHPFIDLDRRGLETNLAHVGFTVAHEMSHSLDDWGSQYDYNGNLHDWWTAADKKKYKKIQEDVIKQYEDFAARDGITFDASIGIGEDIADISGLAICDKFLRTVQFEKNNIIPMQQISFETFYTSFAFQQKQKVDKRALAAQLKTNPHPLDKYRCNIPLSRSQIFRALYDVKKGDGMWWHNTDIIW